MTKTYSQPKSNSYHYRRNNSFTIVKGLYWLAVLATIWFAYLNIQPYAGIVKTVMAETIDSSLFQFVARIPIINGIAATIGSVLHWFVGAVIWACIQTIEILPMVLKRDRAFVRTLVTRADDSDKFDIKEDDEPTLAALKNWYNQFPALTISRARTASLFVYAIDFMICITVYPPASGGWNNFYFLLSTGQYGRLDWGNIAMLIVTLFAIEAIVYLLFELGEIAYFMKSAHTRQS